MSLTNISTFLGLVGYYRRVVEGFFSILSTLTKLTQKMTKFQWFESCEKNYQELKTRLIITLVFTLPESPKCFVVYCDASRVRLRCIFMQNGKVIDYDSRHHKIHE